MAQQFPGPVPNPPLDGTTVDTILMSALAPPSEIVQLCTVKLYVPGHKPHDDESLSFWWSVLRQLRRSVVEAKAKKDLERAMILTSRAVGILQSIHKHPQYESVMDAAARVRMDELTDILLEEVRVLKPKVRKRCLKRQEQADTAESAATAHAASANRTENQDPVSLSIPPRSNSGDKPKSRTGSVGRRLSQMFTDVGGHLADAARRSVSRKSSVNLEENYGVVYDENYTPPIPQSALPPKRRRFSISKSRANSGSRSPPPHFRYAPAVNKNLPTVPSLIPVPSVGVDDQSGLAVDTRSSRQQPEETPTSAPRTSPPAGKVAFAEPDSRAPPSRDDSAKSDTSAYRTPTASSPKSRQRRRHPVTKATIDELMTVDYLTSSYGEPSVDEAPPSYDEELFNNFPGGHDGNMLSTQPGSVPILSDSPEMGYRDLQPSDDQYDGEENLSTSRSRTPMPGDDKSILGHALWGNDLRASSGLSARGSPPIAATIESNNSPEAAQIRIAEYLEQAFREVEYLLQVDKNNAGAALIRDSLINARTTVKTLSRVNQWATQ